MLRRTTEAVRRSCQRGVLHFTRHGGRLGTEKDTYSERLVGAGAQKQRKRSCDVPSTGPAGSGSADRRSGDASAAGRRFQPGPSPGAWLYRSSGRRGDGASGAAPAPVDGCDASHGAVGGVFDGRSRRIMTAVEARCGCRPWVESTAALQPRGPGYTRRRKPRRSLSRVPAFPRAGLETTSGLL